MEYFVNIEDPRRETKNKKYPLIEVIVISFLAVMSGADGWESIERYGFMRKKWLGKFLDLKEGIPKHDVYRRVLCSEHKKPAGKNEICPAGIYLIQ
jgi:hypothetical protein